MQNDTPTAASLEQPADGGLAPRVAGAPTSEPDAPARRGGALIDAAASGESLTDGESNDLLAYYLTNESLPGESDVVPLEVKLGNGPGERTFRVEVRAIEWSEWQDAREHATNPKTGDFDAYVSASWVVARALVTPKLGPAIVRAQREDSDKAPLDAAHLLRRMFHKQSGALLELSAKVLEVSKLQGDIGTIREVEAGKP